MNNEMILAQDKLTFTPEQINLIKSQIAPKATDDELKLFLYQAKRTGLDPLTRQIYAIHRNTKDAQGNWVSKMTIQTSIDGFRVIAERSGDYAGQSEPEFIERDGVLVCCKIAVFRFRGHIRYPAAVGVAYMDESVQLVDEYVDKRKTGKKVPNNMWVKMPHLMLAKVAEALALRKAYPQDLSGLYTSDEIGEDKKEEVVVVKHEEELPKATDEQVKAIGELTVKLNKQQWLQEGLKANDVLYIRDLTFDQAERCLSKLKKEDEETNKDIEM